MRTLPALVCLAALSAPAAAWADEVDDLVTLVEAKPPEMNPTEWKERRRDAARALGRIGDRRAVPALIRVVETEKFDVVGEIAIEALGAIGDPRAVEPLQRVYQDKSRDRYVRQMAAKALRQLGADPSGAPAEPDGAGDQAEAGGVGPAPSTGARILGGAGPIPEGPAFDDDVLSATERLTFAVGSMRLQYASIDRRPIYLDGAASGRFERDVERVSRAYRYGVDGGLTAGILDYDGDDSGGRALTIDALGFADARFYASGQWFGLIQGATRVGVTSFKADRPTDDDTYEGMINLDVHAGIGAGWGRVLEMGEAIRLRRIEKVLAEARMLGRPITPDLAARILRTWWALRGEIGYHDRLVATVRLLRDAGVLLGEPDASTAYKLLQVLADGQLARRPQGFIIHAGIAESYLVRDDVLPVEDGRIETLLLSARYGLQQADGLREIVGEGYARYRILADEGAPSPWSLGATAALRRYVYGEAFDPIGALELAGELGASSDGLGDDDEIGTRLRGSVAWTWTPNRASTFRLAASAGLESGALFIGATFEAAYGLLDVGYVGAGAWNDLR